MAKKTLPNAGTLIPGLVSDIVEDNKPEKKSKRAAKEESVNEPIKERKTKTVTFSFKPSVYEPLREMAWRERISLNEYVGKIFEEYVKENWKG